MSVRLVFVALFATAILSATCRADEQQVPAKCWLSLMVDVQIGSSQCGVDRTDFDDELSNAIETVSQRLIDIGAADPEEIDAYRVQSEMVWSIPPSDPQHAEMCGDQGLAGLKKIIQVDLHRQVSSVLGADLADLTDDCI